MDAMLHGLIEAVLTLTTSDQFKH